jgi:hypothetical protein
VTHEIEEFGEDDEGAEQGEVVGEVEHVDGGL